MTTSTSTLTALDRCDRCSAQAYVRYELNGGLSNVTFDLLFCGHHDRENRAALLAKGATIVADDLLLADAVSGLSASTIEDATS